MLNATCWRASGKIGGPRGCCWVTLSLHPKETMGVEGAGLCILPDALLMIFKSLYVQGRADILINLHVAFKESQMEEMFWHQFLQFKLD